jgi:hypothetical protein
MSRPIIIIEVGIGINEASFHGIRLYLDINFFSRFLLVLEAVCANFTAIFAILDRNYLPHPKKDVGI